MSESLRWHGIRIATALLATLAVVSLGIRANIAWADEPMGEDIVVPPPAPPPAPAPPPPPPPPPPTADEENVHLYLSGNVGGSFAKGSSKGAILGFPNEGSDEDEDVFGGGALGIFYDHSPVGLRAEIEGQAARGYDLTTRWNLLGLALLPLDAEVKTWAMFGNLWLDFPITDSFSIFGGGGVGFAVTDMTTSFIAGVGDKTRDATTFAWQGGGGITIEPSDWLAFDLGYRFIDLGEPEVNFRAIPLSNHELRLQSHDVVLGVRMNFFSF
jgi:opacity protein-like surface antigen